MTPKLFFDIVFGKTDLQPHIVHHCRAIAISAVSLVVSIIALIAAFV